MPKKILAVMPSIRQQKRIECLKTFQETTNDAEIVVSSVIGSTTDAINAAFNSYQDFQYYHLLNDDARYLTKDWDVQLIERIERKGRKGIAYPNDKVSKDLPTFPLISGDIIRCLGWLQLPSLQYLCGDLVWRHIGKELNCLWFCKDVIVEHAQEKDEVYKKTNAQAQYKKDGERFKKWLYKESKKDIKKLRDELGM